MKSGKRPVVILIVLCLMSTIFPVHPIYAETSENNYQMIQVPVFNGNKTKTFEAILYEGDLFFSAEDYSLLTKYSYSAGEQKFKYSLGDKIIVIEPAEEKMTIGALNYSGETGTIIQNDGKYYLSASHLLVIRLGTTWRLFRTVFPCGKLQTNWIIIATCSILMRSWATLLQML